VEKMNILLIGFITILLAVILIGVIADSISSATTLSVITNESLSFRDTVTDTLAQDDISSVTYFGNVSTDLTSSIDTLVNWTRAGVITIDNVTIVEGNTTGSPDGAYNISYLYEDDEYVAHSSSRTLLPLVRLFFAIVVLFIAITLFNKMYKKQ